MNLLDSKKTYSPAILFAVFCLLILLLGLRGIPGNPTPKTLNSTTWKEDGPLELSPERGRFALMYSMIEDNSLTFSLDLARFTTPDVGYVHGKYVSLFAPGLSILIIPGYLLGKYFGASVVGVFAVIALFALFNALLIRAIAIRLKTNPWAANLAAVTFLFATPGFAYGVSLYQHQISTFVILFSIYALMRWDNLWSVALVWFLAAVSIVTDYPNVVLMLPIAIYALTRIIIVKSELSGLQVRLRSIGALTFLTAVLPLALFLWFNEASFGNPLQLSATVTRVQEINNQGLPAQPKVSQFADVPSVAVLNHNKTAVGFFKTRNLLNGFYEHFISPDRGIIRFTPVILLGIFGLILMFRQDLSFAKLFLAVTGLDLLLYSMWGDPYGGWAFGSRYLIPAYALLAVGLGLFLNKLKKNNIVLLIFLAMFGYSVWVNSLGALTSNSNPPQPEILALEQVSGKEEKYTYARNYDYLISKGSKSFVYQIWAKNYLSAKNYHTVVFGLLLAAGVFMIIRLRFFEYDH